MRSESTRSPSKLNSAGSSIIVLRTAAMMTRIDPAPTARLLESGTIMRPASARATVTPLNITVRPVVAPVAASASTFFPVPFARSSR